MCFNFKKGCQNRLCGSLRDSGGHEKPWINRSAGTGSAGAKGLVPTTNRFMDTGSTDAKGWMPTTDIQIRRY